MCLGGEVPGSMGVIDDKLILNIIIILSIIISIYNIYYYIFVYIRKNVSSENSDF